MIRPTAELRTLWFMGSKTRLIPDFIENAVRDLYPGSGAIVDLCAGTSIVGRSLADRYRIISNDSQRFSAVVARAHLIGDEAWRQTLERLDPDEDLGEAFERNLRQLSVLAPEALAREEVLLREIELELGRGPEGRACDEYRKLIDQTPWPERPGSGRSDLFSPLRERFTALLEERGRDPSARPFALTTLYYLNVYFGLRQAMVVDSLRAAIGSLDHHDPFLERKRDLYLAALVYAASISTSGTSHFAQPRSLQKTSELKAVARRRSIDIEQEFYRAVEAIRREWNDHRRRPDNRVFCQAAEDLLAPDGPLASEDVALVYFDPPYTADNYSRFYHLLETLVSYDYPPLESRGGNITRGRYPVRDRRFQSRFCKPKEVEKAFRRIAERTRELGAGLIVSYSDTGLLLSQWSKQGEKRPETRFKKLFRDSFGRVTMRRRGLLHSGQGDSNREVSELLVLCRGE